MRGLGVFTGVSQEWTSDSEGAGGQGSHVRARAALRDGGCGGQASSRRGDIRWGGGSTLGSLGSIESLASC